MTLPASIAALVAQPGEGRAVVFDADGTLWRGDVGEDFLRYLAANNLLVAPPREGAYAKYEAVNHHDPAASYAYAVTVMAGMREDELNLHAGTFFRQRFAGRVFPYVRPLVAQLEANGFDVWVCSASPRWAVEAGAVALGLPKARVIAVESEVSDGRLTSKLLAPVVAGPGKVTWLKRKGVAPLLAIGNGDLDLDMLAFATHAWVVAPPDGSKSMLVREAIARGWPISRF